MTVSFKDGFYDEAKGRADAGASEYGPAADRREREAEPREPQGIAVRLLPTGDADAPVVANYTFVVPSQGFALLDFGFLEPSMLAAVREAVRDGKEPPEVVNGKLATRVALSYEVLANLYMQVGQLFAAMQGPNEAEAGDGKTQ